MRSFGTGRCGGRLVSRLVNELCALGHHTASGHAYMISEARYRPLPYDGEWVHLPLPLTKWEVRPNPITPTRTVALTEQSTHGAVEST
jgi:hypothetical protein